MNVERMAGRNPKFDAILEEIRALHEKKNHDYADNADPLSNFRRCRAVGVDPFRGVLVRLSDKWSRIEQLTGASKAAKNESLRDSLIDSAVYALLAVLLLDESAGAASLGNVGTAPSASAGRTGVTGSGSRATRAKRGRKS